MSNSRTEGATGYRSGTRSTGRQATQGYAKNADLFDHKDKNLFLKDKGDRVYFRILDFSGENTLIVENAQIAKFGGGQYKDRLFPESLNARIRRDTGDDADIISDNTEVLKTLTAFRKKDKDEDPNGFYQLGKNDDPIFVSKLPQSLGNGLFSFDYPKVIRSLVFVYSVFTHGGTTEKVINRVMYWEHDTSKDKDIFKLNTEAEKKRRTKYGFGFTKEPILDAKGKPVLDEKGEPTYSDGVPLYDICIEKIDTTVLAKVYQLDGVSRDAGDLDVPTYNKPHEYIFSDEFQKDLDVYTEGVKAAGGEYDAPSYKNLPKWEYVQEEIARVFDSASKEFDDAADLKRKVEWANKSVLEKFSEAGFKNDAETTRSSRRSAADADPEPEAEEKSTASSSRRSRSAPDPDPDEALKGSEDDGEDESDRGLGNKGKAEPDPEPVQQTTRRRRRIGDDEAQD